MSTRLEGNRVALCVADSGCGIAEEIRPYLFQPFFTTKPSGVGTGLGLSICQQIITALGGTIEYTSEVGRGTEFRRAPAGCAPAAGSRPRPRSHRRARPPEPATGSS